MHPGRDTRKAEVDKLVIALTKAIEELVPPGPHRTMAQLKVDKASQAISDAFNFEQKAA